jgi:hypothetical protein
MMDVQANLNSILGLQKSGEIMIDQRLKKTDGENVDTGFKQK